jgi:hypothetical protein
LPAAATGTVLTTTAFVTGALIPQLLPAATEILPPEAPIETVIEFVVLDPVHPTGNVHE